MGINWRVRSHFDDTVSNVQKNVCKKTDQVDKQLLFLLINKLPIRECNLVNGAQWKDVLVPKIAI